MDAQPKTIRQQQADETRNTILRAASQEFSQKGFDGASTVAIMESAGVNTSLLYYYFKNKSGLYEAVIRSAVERYMEQSASIMQSSDSPGERVLRATLIHFDRYIRDHEAQSLLQQELLRFWGGRREFVSILAIDLFTPWLEKMKETVELGVETGELRAVEWRHVVGCVLGGNTFYFLNAPLFGLALGIDPYSEAELNAQRSGAVRFLSQTLFADPERGAEIAARVLAELPMPAPKKFRREGEAEEM